MTKTNEKLLLFYIAALIVLSITLMYSYADADTYYTDPILIKLDKLEDRKLAAFDKVGCNDYPDSYGCQLRAEEIEKIQIKTVNRLKELGE